MKRGTTIAVAAASIVAAAVLGVLVMTALLPHDEVGRPVDISPVEVEAPTEPLPTPSQPSAPSAPAVPPAPPPPPPGAGPTTVAPAPPDAPDDDDGDDDDGDDDD